MSHYRLSEEETGPASCRDCDWSGHGNAAAEAHADENMHRVAVRTVADRRYIVNPKRCNHCDRPLRDHSLAGSLHCIFGDDIDAEAVADRVIARL